MNDHVFTTEPRVTQRTLQQIIAHQNTVILEREEIIPFIWVNRIAQQHILLVGGAGIAKSMIARNTIDHITGGYSFETSFDETSDPGVAFGPTDVKAIAEGGGQKRLIDGMLPQAEDAFLDEIFNANGPTLRSLQPALNERLYHQGRQAIKIPLRSMMAGTNQLTTETRLKALYDRLSQRHIIQPLQTKEAQIQMAVQAVERLDKRGRGKVTEVDTDLTTVSIDELDDAHHAALRLGVSDTILDTYYDLRQNLVDEGGITISDRRFAESLATVLANAWLRGHDEVTIGDMDVLVHMWWEKEEDRITARNLILDVVNPADKFAMDGFETLKELKENAKALNDMTETSKNHEATEITKNLGKQIALTQAKILEAGQQGWPTEKLERLIASCDDLADKISSEVYGIQRSGTLASIGGR